MTCTISPLKSRFIIKDETIKINMKIRLKIKSKNKLRLLIIIKKKDILYLGNFCKVRV